MRLIRTILSFLLSVIIGLSAGAQGIEGWIKSVKPTLLEKVYLHIDREFYSQGDRIWFASYLTEATGNRLMPGFKNIYVQLVNDSGCVVANRLLLSHEGVAQGDILIGDTIPDGQYTIRARTKYLENFGEPGCFHRKIWISSAKSSLELQKLQIQNRSVIDVSFLPEGGNLVAEMLNHVAFKAVNQTGKGVNVRGRIVDDSDSLVTTFSSSYLGMGKFIFMPGEGKRYRALIDGHPDFYYAFDAALPDAFGLHFTDLGREVLITVGRNIHRSESEQLYLAASHKGIVLFYKEITLDSFEQALKVEKGKFPLGISKITLLDQNVRVVAERLVFIGNGNEDLISLTLNKEEFSTREKAELSLVFRSEWNDTVASTLSVAVVNTDYLSTGGSSLSINSYLLLSSELKGHIEAHASFFSDSQTLKSSEKLDLLMMVNGWRSYWWDHLSDVTNIDLKGWDDAGITVTGYLKALLREERIPKGKVVLGPQKPNFFTEVTTTDSEGRFVFKRLYLKDSSLLMLNASNEKGRKNVEIILEPVLPFPRQVNAEMVRSSAGPLEVAMRFYRENYYRQMKLEEFDPEKGSILLDDIEVTALLKEKDDGHFRMFGEPDQSLKISKDDFTYLNILDYLDGRVGGLVISGESVSIRAGGQPLFILDGFIIDDEELKRDLILHTPLSDIDKIDIVKNGFGMAAFGSRGADGVIAVYTKKGIGEPFPDREKFVRGRLTARINGFRSPTRFYAPKYTPENRHNPAPDYRPTLHWEPSLSMEEGKGFLEFFTSDELAVYTVIAEGITKKGRMCRATASFTVTKKAP